MRDGFSELITAPLSSETEWWRVKNRWVTIVDKNWKNKRTICEPNAPSPFILGIGSFSHYTCQMRNMHLDRLSNELVSGLCFDDQIGRGMFGIDFHPARRVYYFATASKPLQVELIDLKLGKIAEGKIFVDILPNGLTRLTSIVVSQLEQRAPSAFCPWEASKTVLWVSRLGKKSGPALWRTLHERIAKSVYVNASAVHTATNYSSVILPNQVPDHNNGFLLPLTGLHGFDEDQDGLLEDCANQLPKNAGYLHIKKSSLLFAPHHWTQRRGRLKFFERYRYIQDFAEFRSALLELLAREIFERIKLLRLCRLDPIAKIASEDLLKVRQYDRKIINLFHDSGSCIQPLSPLHKLIYAKITQFGHGEVRHSEVKQLIQEWEGEIEKWTHPISWIWEKLFAPIRGLIGR